VVHAGGPDVRGDRTHERRRRADAGHPVGARLPRRAVLAPQRARRAAGQRRGLSRLAAWSGRTRSGSLHGAAVPRPSRSACQVPW
jgi:hypothetical protein